MASTVETKKDEKKEPMRIKVPTHEKFDGDMKTKITSSIEMANVVSSLFGGAFADYWGCKIKINDGSDPFIANTMPIGTIYVNLFFKDQGNATGDLVKNLVSREAAIKEDGKPTMGERFARVSGSLTNNRAYTVTKETYEALTPFAFGPHIRWSEHTSEILSPMSTFGKEEVLVCITGLSFNKIITEIYGEATEEGRFEYLATPSTVIPSNASEFVMQVAQLDLAAVRSLQNTLGVYGGTAPDYHQFAR